MEQGVDYRCLVRYHGSLEQVAKEREDRMEPLKVPLLLLDDYALHQFRQDDQIQDDGSGKERVLASVMHDYSVVPAHKDLGRVFIHSSLAVANIRHILDNHLGSKEDT